MHELPGESGLNDFNRRLMTMGRAAFLLDFDGTLAPFELDPADVRPYPGVAEALDSIMDLGRARVVVITGRYLKSAPPSLGTRSPPETWGSHGRERLMPDGTYAVAGLDDYALRALTIADSWSPEIEAAGGRCEAKPGSLAFHWRGAGPTQVIRIRNVVTQNFNNEAFEGVLDLRSFDGGIELRAPGLNKGNVVKNVLAETADGVPVAYLGDDQTDEDAFVALRGRGLGVLVRPEYRQTAADYWIKSPEGLLWLLRMWRDALAAAKG